MKNAIDPRDYAIRIILDEKDPPMEEFEIEINKDVANVLINMTLEERRAVIQNLLGDHA